jgi:hypothetical protein
MIGDMYIALAGISIIRDVNYSLSGMMNNMTSNIEVLEYRELSYTHREIALTFYFPPERKPIRHY